MKLIKYNNFNIQLRNKEESEDMLPVNICCAFLLNDCVSFCAAYIEKTNEEGTIKWGCCNRLQNHGIIGILEGENNVK